MPDITLSGEMTVGELLGRWPQTAAVFQRLHMACLGCPVSAHCLISDAAAAYKLPLEPFLVDLEKAILGE